MGNVCDTSSVPQKLTTLFQEYFYYMNGVQNEQKIYHHKGGKKN